MYGETSETYLFDSLSLEDGLSSSSVSSIQQDSKGFLWFGTQSGLSRYDGYEFITYNHDVFDENSLPHGLVQSLFIDNDDIIWVGTYNGISRFDPSKIEFTNYEYDQKNEQSISNNVVTAMTKDQNGQLWIATMNGFNRLDPETGLFRRYMHDPENPDSLLNNTVRSVIVDSQNRVWVGSLSGIDLYNRVNDNFIHYATEQTEGMNLPSPYVMKLLQYSDDIMLVGTWDGGLTLLNIKTGTTESFPLKDNRVYSMEIDARGLVWIGTWGGGLFIFDISDHSILQINKDEKLNSSITSDTIYSLFRDDSGIMWVGTNGEGINKHNSQKKDYNFLTYDNQSEQSIDPGKIECLLEDSTGNIWIGPYNGGVNHYNIKTGVIKHYKFREDDETSLSNNIVNDLIEDSSGNIWISTNEGLNIYNRESDNFRRLFLNPLEEKDLPYSYTVLYEDKEKNIWIGSHNYGLFKYNPATEEVKNYQSDGSDMNTISDNLIYSILENENGEFWIGTNKGLNQMDRETGLFNRFLLDRENPRGLNNNAIRTMLEDRDHNLWIGTGGGGLNILNYDRGQFSHITTRDGLSNNFIMSMELDDRENLWIGTKYGVSIINTNTHEIEIMDKEDGLTSMEFTSASFIGSDNNIYLGSIDLINKFDTKPIDITSFHPDIYLNSIEISGKKYEGYSPYEPSSDLILEYKDSNYLAFEYVALNYLSPHTTNYAHKLVGFDNDWIFDQSRRFALYTNLPTGEYTFQVKASLTKGIWNDKIFEQKVRIKSPFWRTWWAYTIYFFIVVLLIYMIISVRTNFIRKERIFELKRAERYLSDILNSMPSILIGINEDLIITQWNREAEKFSGKSEKEAKGKRLDELLPDLPMDLKEIKNSLSSGRIFTTTERTKTDGNEIKYEVLTIYPLGKMKRKEAVIRIDDVTKQVRMEEIIIQSEKMLSVGGLAAGMAHEINNPLAGMIQSASVLKNRLWNNSGNKSNERAANDVGTDFITIRSYMESREIPRIVDSINESGKRIASIVDNMLSFAHKDNSVFTSQDFSDLLEKTLILADADYDLKKQYDFKDLKLIRKYEENMPRISCEKSKIQQVLLNILRNGAEAMYYGGTTNPQLILSLYKDSVNNYAVLEIEDNGPGMDNEVKKRIFEPFFTTKPVGIGTGLGLSISYFIITENHKGKIKVESDPGQGTTFIIKLPLESDSKNVIPRRQTL